MKKRYLYKYVQNGKIVYIGKTDNIHSRIGQHKADLPPDCEIYIGECPNTVSQYAFEALLIDHYRPIYNTSFIYEDEQIFENCPLWEPEWIEYSIFCKQEQKSMQDRVAQPTPYQLQQAEKYYQEQLNCLDKCIKPSLWENWLNCVQEKHDFCYKKARMPHPFSRHQYAERELIPWKVIFSWMIVKAAEIQELYNSYYSYATNRGIQAKPFSLKKQYPWMFVEDSVVTDHEKLLDSYIDKVRISDRKRQLEEWHEQCAQECMEQKRQEQLKNFVKEWQPIYVSVTYDEKDLYKRWGCKWDPDKKSWYVSEYTWQFANNPQPFFNRMASEYIEKAIAADLLKEDDLSKKARVAYNVFKKKREVTA